MAIRWMVLETTALDRRLRDLPRFADTIPMVAAAAPAHGAVCLADRAVQRSRARLRRDLVRFVRAFERPRTTDVRAAQRRYLELRGQFSHLLSTVDVFSDALTQRAEHGTGVVLRGLDVLAQDGLHVGVPNYEPPPLVCYLDDAVPGAGGAIRRAFTRLPGGETNTVGLIRIPRERLLGLGLASLLHEVGHQGVALLDLLPDYRAALRVAAERGELAEPVVEWWSLKLSEVLPDLWAVAKLGVTATLGLFAVLGRQPLATYYDIPTDPHPSPWLRALTSVAWGARILPHPLWASLRSLWLTLYPVDRAPEAARPLLSSLVPSVEPVVRCLARVRPASLAGATLAEALGAPRVHPARLLPTLVNDVRALNRAACAGSPCRALASVGLARQLGVIPAEEEHDVLARQISMWARGGNCRHQHFTERDGP